MMLRSKSIAAQVSPRSSDMRMPVKIAVRISGWCRGEALAISALISSLVGNVRTGSCRSERRSLTSRATLCRTSQPLMSSLGLDVVFNVTTILIERRTLQLFEFTPCEPNLGGIADGDRFGRGIHEQLLEHWFIPLF